MNLILRRGASALLTVIAAVAVGLKAFAHTGNSLTALLAAWVLLFVAGNAMSPASANLFATLTPTKILKDMIDCFFVENPMLNFFSTDFTAETLKKGQVAKAHITTAPTAFDYVAADGYGTTGSQDADDLKSDVSVTISKHKVVSLKITHDDLISSEKQRYQEHIRDGVRSLGLAVVDDVLSGVVAANISATETETIANTDVETLNKVTKKLTTRKAGPMRYGIINSDFALSLRADGRLTSKDYVGQGNDGNPFLALQNVHGFQQVREYTSLPTTGNMSGFFFDKRAVVLKTGLPADSSALAAELGLPVTVKTQVLQDPKTGLSFLGIFWMEPSTLTIHMAVTLLYGFAVGKIGGDADTLLDRAAVRVITA